MLTEEDVRAARFTRIIDQDVHAMNSYSDRKITARQEIWSRIIDSTDYEENKTWCREELQRNLALYARGTALHETHYVWTSRRFVNGLGSSAYEELERRSGLDSVVISLFAGHLATSECSRWAGLFKRTASSEQAIAEARRDEVQKEYTFDEEAQ